MGVYYTFPSRQKRCQVLCVEENKVYPSLSDAAMRHGTSSGAISAVCKGKQRTAGGYHWRYADEEEQE